MRPNITDYGMREAFEFVNVQPDNTFDPRDIDFLLDQLLSSIPEDGLFPDNFIVKIKGKPVTAEDAFGMIMTQLPRLRMDAINLFEDYFREGTDAQKLLNDYESGDGEARKVFRYMGIFLIEAVNVRTELAFPQLMSLRAGLSEEDRAQFGLYRFFGPMEWAEIQGPHVPPLPASRVVQLLRERMPEIDQLARNIIANGSAPEARAFNS